jgi:peptide/nickel transport system substrate-binding protein
MTRFRTSLALLTCAALLAACGGGDDDPTSSTSGSAAESSSESSGATAEPSGSADESVSADDSAAPADGGVLIVAEGQDTAEMDPQTSFFDMTWRLQSMVYETLVTTNENLEIVPALAASWTQPDATTYVFSLQPGVTFSNGRAMTADDVVGSLQRLIDPATGSYWAPQLGPVESITAVDASTVEVKLSAPYEPLLAALANVSAAVLPMEELTAGSFDPTTQMLGTGPFALGEHLPDQSWTFNRNDAYWRDGLPVLDGVEVRVVPDDATRVAALRDGSVHAAYFASPDAPALLEGADGVEVTVQGSSDMYWLMLNGVNPESPFADQRVRQAVAYALDRDAIIANALAGTGQGTAIASAGLAGACPTDQVPTYTRDVEQAKALLAEAGAEDLTFELIAPPTLATLSPIAQVIQQSLGEAGITVEVVTPEIGAYIDSVYVQQPGQFDGVVDYFAGYLDPRMVMQFLVPERNPTLAGFSIGSPELTAAIDAAAASGAGDRDAAVATVCDLTAELAAIVPIATKESTIGLRTDLVAGDVAGFDAYDIYLRDVAAFSLTGD